MTNHDPLLVKSTKMGANPIRNQSLSLCRSRLVAFTDSHCPLLAQANRLWSFFRLARTLSKKLLNTWPRSPFAEEEVEEKGGALWNPETPSSARGLKMMCSLGRTLRKKVLETITIMRTG